MFTAALVQAYRHTSPFTKGKSYEVIDFNEYFGTYTILNDDGARANVDWMRFEDQGRKSEEYSRTRSLAA
jgi:hypothetical protein